MASMQKALILTKKFGDFTRAGEVLVKIIATSLNPVDWKIQKYGIIIENYPAILGTDVSGEVEEVGEGVIEFKKGDRVFTQGQIVNGRASFQQYAITLATSLARIPDNTSFDEASTFPVALNVVYVGLYNEYPYGIGMAPPISADTQGIYGGTAIIILGGASSVGQNGTYQLAKISGFSPIITTASLKHTDYLKALGATEITSAPIKIVSMLSSESTQRTVLSPTVKPEQGKIVIGALGILREPPNVELLEKFYHDVISALLRRPNNIEVLPGGLARMQSDQVSKLKLVVHPQETA
ncbi:chaperonin 10-like protein [Pholiota molesta]|nr:chaperonin 10-like protein [Pholiota molesta]